ncbi:hypothetical protein B0H11DRAFT_1898464 [Mycena galericulata]|nr:hypothetical protein B0H11DRAFT_1898464 [Mycena galericulata]
MRGAEGAEKWRADEEVQVEEGGNTGADAPRKVSETCGAGKRVRWREERGTDSRASEVRGFISWKICVLTVFLVFLSSASLSSLDNRSVGYLTYFLARPSAFAPTPLSRVPSAYLFTARHILHLPRPAFSPLSLSSLSLQRPLPPPSIYIIIPAWTSTWTSIAHRIAQGVWTSRFGISLYTVHRIHSYRCPTREYVCRGANARMLVVGFLHVRPIHEGYEGSDRKWRQDGSEERELTNPSTTTPVRMEREGGGVLWCDSGLRTPKTMRRDPEWSLGGVGG